MSDQIHSQQMNPASPSFAAAPQPQAEPSRPAVAAPRDAQAPPTIPLSVEEYQRLRSLEKQLDNFQRLQQSALDAKEAERLRLLAEKGQVEEALAQQRTAWEQKMPRC